MLLICGSNPAYSRRLCSSRLGPRIGTAGAALAVATLVVAGYLQGPVSTGGALSLREFAALNNLLAWPICVSALGLLFLESYPVGALLLSGLFLYDAFFVFKSDVMITVATQLEAPAKLLFLGSAQNIAEGKYPFSVLGLGDIAIPGAFVALLRQFDEAQAAAAAPNKLAPRDASGSPLYSSPYFTSGMVGYTAGLLGAFVANAVTKAGQPALVYIVPSLLLASAGTAVVRGELDELLQFKSPRAARAKEQLEARKAEREAERAKEQKGV
eukprot:Transcript_13588.p1 GENE.Transcript_13588~~Transcript_13588.p1  ORF type:complete len:270 (-),score=108.18 Transcript_13588:22-831(-)